MNANRRNFIRGKWQQGGGQEHTGGSAEIASILVQTRPERLTDVEHAIGTLAGTEIMSRDARGKLVVVLEAAGGGAVGATLNTIALLPHVLSATLVYHATDV
jgi:nitrate reductase NapD